MGLTYLVIALVLWGFAAVVNRLLGRPAVNGGTVALGVLGILLVLRIAAAVTSPDAGHRVGVAIGESIFGLAVGVAASRSFARAKARSSAQV